MRQLISTILFGAMATRPFVQDDEVWQPVEPTLTHVHQHARVRSHDEISSAHYRIDLSPSTVSTDHKRRNKPGKGEGAAADQLV